MERGFSERPLVVETWYMVLEMTDKKRICLENGVFCSGSGRKMVVSGRNIPVLP